MNRYIAAPGRRLGLLLATTILAAVCLGGLATIVAAQPPPPSSVVDKCRTDLASRLHIAVGRVSMRIAVPTNWPDSSLGLPREGMMYAQMVTPGWRLTLEANGRPYRYHIGRGAFAYAGPENIWSYSAAYIAPLPNEPNLNGTLMQVSLLGTNPAPLIEHVSAFWPLETGGILAKRRESRSGHALLYRPPSGGAPVELYGAMDFGVAAASPAGDEWVAFARPGMGSGWVIAHGKLKGGPVKTVKLPDNTWPGDLGLAHGTLLARLTKGISGPSVSYEVVTRGAEWSLRPLGPREPGLGSSFMLNKSQNLEIRTQGQGRAAVTHVVKRWFNGNEDPVATIQGFAYKTATLTPDLGYVFLSGTGGEGQAAYTVAVGTGEVIPLGASAAHGAKLCFLAPVSQPRAVRGPRIF